MILRHTAEEYIFKQGVVLLKYRPARGETRALIGGGG